jgi:hypothetical protein
MVRIVIGSGMDNSKLLPHGVHDTVRHRRIYSMADEVRAVRKHAVIFPSGEVSNKPRASKAR